MKRDQEDPLALAIEVFVKGFAIQRSVTTPYEAVPFGPVWVMRDAAPRPDPRNTEFVALRLPPDKVVETVRAYGIPPKYGIVTADDDDGTDHLADRNRFVELGYRLMNREPVFVRDLREPIPEPTVPVRRIESKEDAARVAKAIRHRLLRPSDLGPDDPLSRAYWCEKDGSVVGWVRSMKARDDARWIGDLATIPAYRRQGIATSLMNAALSDDRTRGALWSCLVASWTGSRLYPLLGYRRVGLLHCYVPRKESASR
ncbi:MAG: GNAT family N-acetyltransferase [Fimbriimonadaceae bacterium]|nr:GNAT family N-acetyltransferase [Fimbriimonadaceae bacterium]